MYKSAVLSGILLFSAAASAHEATSLDDLLTGWGMNLEEAEVTSETVAPGIHVLFGLGGNVVVSIGEQGVLMVDSQFPELIPRLQAEIRKLGGGDIDFTINTHFHFDHADGNPALGREGTWMISQINTRNMMLDEHPIDLVSVLYNQPPYPAEALPVITYEDRMQLFFNGERIDLMHFAPAHTTGDTAVFFRAGNVVHMGDVFVAGYPFVDAGNGGDLDGMIRFVGAAIDELNQDSVVVPGHGPTMRYADLVAFHGMLVTVRARIMKLIDSGASLEQVIAAKPTAEFDEKYGDPGLLLNRAYMNLSR